MNNYVCVGNLTDKPERIGGDDEKPLVKIRMADNTFGRNAEVRYFDALLVGVSATTALKLDKGDELVVAGILGRTSYKAKKGKNKGQKVFADELKFGQILKVTRSPSFFGAKTAEDGEVDMPTDDSDDATEADTEGEDPLADLKAL